MILEVETYITKEIHVNNDRYLALVFWATQRCIFNLDYLILDKETPILCK